MMLSKVLGMHRRKFSANLSILEILPLTVCPRLPSELAMKMISSLLAKMYFGLLSRNYRLLWILGCQEGLLLSLGSNCSHIPLRLSALNLIG